LEIQFHLRVIGSTPLTGRGDRAGEIAAHQCDLSRYAREREAYSNRRRIRPDPVPDRPPAGEITELEPVPKADPELVEILEAYFARNPQRREEKPSWLSVALWADEYLPNKPSPAAVELALLKLHEVAA
jgi:hypothetical protein